MPLSTHTESVESGLCSVSPASLQNLRIRVQVSFCPKVTIHSSFCNQGMRVETLVSVENVLLANSGCSEKRRENSTGEGRKAVHVTALRKAGLFLKNENVRCKA